MTAIVVALAAVAALACVAAVVMASGVARRAAAPSRLEAEFRAQAAMVARLADGLSQRALGDEAMRAGMEQTRRLVGELEARERDRRQRDEEARTALRRLESTLLGAASRGRIGENVVWEALQQLPPDMVDTGFKVGGKVVEFALLLPDGRRLPVDSKWAAVAELEALETAEGADRVPLAQAVERLVAERAREVAKYLDPSLTAPFAVAAVPDAAYAVVRRAHRQAFESGVLLAPYSAALPVLLALYSLCCRLAPGDRDVGALVSEVRSSLDGIERALENSVERGARMAQNGAGEIRTQVGRARGALGASRAADDDAATRLRAVD